MSSDLDDYYTPRVKSKHKTRHTYPNRHVDSPRIRPPPIRQRNLSFPSIEDESSEKCIIKEYSSHNRLKKEIVITKRKKVHPATDEVQESEPELDSELILKCLAAVSRKIIRMLCYLAIL